MRTVMVTGATGRQGGAVARALLVRGFDVLALTRDTESDAAQELTRIGARLVRGDLGEPRSLRRALDGAEAAFCVTAPDGDERQQGIHQIDAAREAGCPHLVLSTVAGSERSSGIGSFEAKHEVERHLARSGLPFTVLRPTWFLENLLTPRLLGGLAAGRLGLPLPPDRPLDVVALSDLGALVALAIEQPHRFLGRTLDVASDTCLPALMADTLTTVVGAPIAYQVEPAPGGSPRQRLYDWLRDVGFGVDVGALHAELPEVGWHRFGRWAAAQDWSVIGRHGVYVGAS